MPAAIDQSLEKDSAQNLNDAIEDLQNASQTPARLRQTKPTAAIDTICEHAYENGLGLDPLINLINIVTSPGHLDQSTLSAIVRNLYPSEAVPNDAVQVIVGALGEGSNKPSVSIQGGLLRWLVMVYDVLEHPKVLGRLYGVLFNLLDMISLRPSLCHLLSLITRRQHVRPYRIQMLMELARNVGEERPLLGLIRVFKDYYPDVIVGNTTKGRAALFHHPDKDWHKRLLEIQDAHARAVEGSTIQRSTFKVVRRGFNGVKSRKASSIPEVHTSRANESSVTLEEVEGVDDFIEKIEKLELPNQSISVLEDSLMQKYLELRESNIASRRLDNWLHSFFEEELASIFDHNGEETRVTEVLKSIISYAQATKRLPGQSCQKFLRNMLPEWDGHLYRREILELLSFSPIRSFQELHATYFNYMEAAILENTLSSLQTVLDMYTSLLKRWTAYLLAHPKKRYDHLGDPLGSLIAHVDVLSLSMLESTNSQPNLSATSSILVFWEVVASATQHITTSESIRICIPSAPLVYHLIFTSSLSNLSRICAVLAIYKRAFEEARNASNAKGGEGAYTRDYVNRFNGYLMDICNCLWRNRAFNREDMNALGCLAPPSVLPPLRIYADSMGYQLPAMFSLSYSTVLCAISIDFFREIEDLNAEEIVTRHRGPVTQRSLTALGNDGGLTISWADYRLGILRWLENRGVHGVSELMYNTMKHLMVSKEIRSPAVNGAFMNGDESSVGLQG